MAPSFPTDDERFDEGVANVVVRYFPRDFRRLINELSGSSVIRWLKLNGSSDRARGS